jgi:hypothetical protein
MPYAALGEWYISVVCKHCSHRILLFHDLSEGKSELRQSRLHITCPQCQKEGPYVAEHYQHAALPEAKLSRLRLWSQL